MGVNSFSLSFCMAFFLFRWKKRNDFALGLGISLEAE